MGGQIEGMEEVEEEKEKDNVKQFFLILVQIKIHTDTYICFKKKNGLFSFRYRSLVMFSLNMEIKASLPPGVQLHTSHQDLRL